MTFPALIVFLLAGLPWPLLAQTTALPDRPLEKLPLGDAGNAKAWSTAESTLEWAAGGPAWRWHVPVDHFSGEKNYPIGWPRIGWGIPAGPARDWAAWDYFHVWVYCSTNRDALPRDPAGLGLHTPDRANALQRSLAELQKDTWVEILIPTSQIPRAGDVRQVQFHISESNYRHGDAVDFQLRDMALLRYAAPTLLAFAPESAVVFADAGRIAARASLAGVKPGERAELSCELRQGDRIVAKTKLTAIRGEQRLTLEWGTTPLPAGDYTLSARILGRENTAATAPLRLVGSPWK